MLPTPAEPAAPSLPSHCTALRAAGQLKSRQPRMPDHSSPVTVNKPVKPAQHNVQWGFSSQLHYKLQTNCLPIISVVPFYISASQVPPRLCLSGSPTDAHMCLLPRDSDGHTHSLCLASPCQASCPPSLPSLCSITPVCQHLPASLMCHSPLLPGYVLT